jgi:hypothetical protein
MLPAEISLKPKIQQYSKLAFRQASKKRRVKLQPVPDASWGFPTHLLLLDHTSYLLSCSSGYGGALSLPEYLPSISPYSQTKPAAGQGSSGGTSRLPENNSRNRLLGISTDKQLHPLPKVAPYIPFGSTIHRNCSVHSLK